MGEKRKVTLVSLSLILDGEFSKNLLEKAYLPAIRQVCMVGYPRYAPEVWITSTETKEMEIIPK